MKELNKNLGYSWLSQIPSNLFGILVGILVTRILGAEGRGVYFLFQTNSQFLLMFIGLGINTGLIYFISNGKIAIEKLSGIVISSLAVMSILGLMLLIGVRCFSIETVIPKGFGDHFFYVYLYVFFFLQLVASILNGTLAGYKEFKLISLLTIGSSSIKLVAFLFLYICHEFYHPISLQTVFVLSLVIQLINTAWWILMSRKFMVPPSFHIRHELASFFKFSITQHVATFLNFFNYRIDLYFLSHFSGLAEIGIYTLAVNIAQLLWVVSQPIAGVLYPYLTSAKDQEERIGYLQKYSKLNTVLTLLGVIGIFFGAYLVPYIYGQEFSRSIWPLQILVFGTFISGLSKPFSTFFASTGRVRINLLATIIGLSSTLILGLLLIPNLGPIGASLTSLAAYGIIFLSLIIVGIKYRYFPTLNYFIPSRKDIFVFIQIITRK